MVLDDYISYWVMGKPNCVRGYCDGSRWCFDSSNARELWMVMQQRIFYNRGPRSSHVL